MNFYVTMLNERIMHMSRILWRVLLIVMILVAGQNDSHANDKSYHDSSLKAIDQDLRRVSQSDMSNQGKMVYYSGCFMNAPYELACEGEGENGYYETEPLLNIRKINCMTFCEIVLALSLSNFYEEFFNVLQHIRYRQGIISMATRNHYTMADWLPANRWCLRDVSQEVGREHARELMRPISHRKFFKTKGITDLPVVFKDRNVTITYIPLEYLEQHEADLESGDIVALIQNKPDIFSAHMLLVIKKEGETYFRHASMKAGKVVDEVFQTYIDNLAKSPRYLGMSFMRIREDVDWQLKNAYRGKIVLPQDTVSTSWIISDSTVLPQNKPANAEVEQLLMLLAAEEGPGQSVEKDEFVALLQKASPIVYEEKLIKYATPNSIAIQNQDHENLTQSYVQEEWFKAGVEFLKNNSTTLQNAEKKYAVAVKDIISILLWESRLGQYAGDYRVFNIFLGQLLYLDMARERAIEEIIRSGNADSVSIELTAQEVRRFVRLKRNAVRNLAALIRISMEKGVDPTEVIGSWGGAIGYVQFMPSSMIFAVDGNDDDVIDLFSWPDAIFSVANYLRENGYRKSDKGRRRGILAYNPLDSYVEGVIAYADAFWQYYEREISIF